MNKPKWIPVIVLANLALTASLLALFGFQTVRALYLDAQTAPGVISYQGVLKDSAGVPVDGVRNLEFAIYDAESAGGSLWLEAHPATLVSAGAFAVQLGQNTPFPETLFDAPDRWLEIRVEGEALEPRQKFSSVPYALNADTLDGYDATELGGGGLPSGAVIYFPIGSSPAGFTPKAGALAMDMGPWEPIPPAPVFSWNVTKLLWTGNKLFFLVNQADSAGAYFDMTNNTWEIISDQGAPTYDGAGIVWAGDQIIAWNGISNSGARYYPAIDVWVPISTSGAPSYRINPISVWVGDKMFIWGGHDLYGGPINDGALYNPASNAWSPVSVEGAPSGDTNYSGIWTGTRVIMYPGPGRPAALYDPAMDAWSPMSTTNGPGEYVQECVWTGSEMVTRSYDMIHFYSPTTDTWRKVPLEPTNTTILDIAFTGDTLIFVDGIYDLVDNQWTAFREPMWDAIAHDMYWTGSQLLIAEFRIIQGVTHPVELYVPYTKD
jgi:hypothetical protein